MRRAVRNPVLLVVAGFMLMQAAWILTIPPFRGSDEVDHAYRAAAVAGGQWVAGEYAENGRGNLVEVPASLVRAAEAQCEELPYTGPDNCEAVAETSDGNVRVASSAAGYHPAFYWFVGSAGRPFDGAAALYAMRVASAALCLVFLGMAGWAVSKLRNGWPVAGLLLAATPVLVYSTTVVAPNGLEMSAALALWTSLLAFAHGHDPAIERRLLLVAIISAVVMCTLRMLGPLFVLLIVGTIAAFDWRALWTAVRRHQRAFLVGCLLVGVTVVEFAWWSFGVQIESGSSEIDGSGSIRLGHAVVWPLQTIAAFPYRDQMGAAIVYPVIGTLVLALLFLAVRLGTRHERRVITGALVLGLALPFCLTFATLDSVGNIWQGRYGLPYSVGFVLLSGYVVGRYLKTPTMPWALAAPVLLVMGAVVVACLIKVRDDELAENEASRVDPTWIAPSSWILIALVAAAMLMWAICLYATRDRDPSNRESVSV